MYSELHEFYRQFIFDNCYKQIKWVDGGNADFGGLIYAYLGNDIYLYDISTIDNELHYIVTIRTEINEEVSHNDLFCFDTKTDHIGLLIDFINKI
jgi:hypothetical protein